MSASSAKFAGCKPQFSEFEFDIVHCGGINQQAADAMSRRQTVGTDKTKMDNEMLVLTITTNMFNTHKTEQEQETRENYEKPTKQ